MHAVRLPAINRRFWNSWKAVDKDCLFYYLMCKYHIVKYINQRRCSVAMCWMSECMSKWANLYHELFGRTTATKISISAQKATANKWTNSRKNWSCSELQDKSHSFFCLSIRRSPPGLSWADFLKQSLTLYLGCYFLPFLYSRLQTTAHHQNLTLCQFLHGLWAKNSFNIFEWLAGKTSKEE